MKISEIFVSCQGEGPDCGLPAVFVRLRGCNVRCKWCDTPYALNFRDDLDTPLESVIDKIKSLTKDSDIGYVIITGGEPLLQADEVYKLIKYLHRDFYFAIETNGTQPVPVWWREAGWDVDRKCPSSGVNGFLIKWGFMGRNHCRVKFVVYDEQDLEFVLRELKESAVFHNPLSPHVLISPAIRREWLTTADDRCQAWLQKVWNFCVENNLRYSLQVHKVVFGERRGV